ncbi:hypothetical protein AVEN_59707-2-1, partial [Araneus ventricosus]
GSENLNSELICFPSSYSNYTPGINLSITVTGNRVTPSLPKHSGELKNGRHDSSDIEVGVLNAITCHCPTPPEGGTFRHRCRVTQSSSLLWPQDKREPFTHPSTSHPRTRGAIRCGLIYA